MLKFATECPSTQVLAKEIREHFTKAQNDLDLHHMHIAIYLLLITAGQHFKGEKDVIVELYSNGDLKQSHFGSVNTKFFDGNLFDTYIEKATTDNPLHTFSRDTSYITTLLIEIYLAFDLTTLYKIKLYLNDNVYEYVEATIDSEKITDYNINYDDLFIFCKFTNDLDVLNVESKEDMVKTIRHWALDNTHLIEEGKILIPRIELIGAAPELTTDLKWKNIRTGTKLIAKINTELGNALGRRTVGSVYIVTFLEEDSVRVTDDTDTPSDPCSTYDLPTFFDLKEI